jgi:hypothetical protein
MSTTVSDAAYRPRYILDELTLNRFACLVKKRTTQHCHNKRLPVILPPSIRTPSRRPSTVRSHHVDQIARRRIQLSLGLSRSITIGPGGRSARRLLPQWVVERFPFNRSRSSSPHGRWWPGTASRSVSRSRHAGPEEPPHSG